MVHSRLTALLIAGALGLFAQARATAAVSFRWVPAEGTTTGARLEVTGVDGALLEQLRQAKWTLEEWQEVLSVYADQGDLITDVTLPPILGAYRLAANAIWFEPAFAWEPGVPYRAVWRPGSIARSPDSTGELASSSFRIPLRSRAADTVVTQIYPSGNVLPENLLKFYLHFSSPMSRGGSYSHIQLKNEAGQAVELPFLEIAEELWDPSMRRLTLIIDPGRIKRGLRPLEEIGPALEEGKRFTLLVDREWPDGAGQPLKQSFEKTFRVGPPERAPLDPAEWQLSSPLAGSLHPVVLDCGKPLDHALAQRVIQVVDADGRVVRGTVGLAKHESQWSFVPDLPWRAGKYEIVIETTLEDLAGNNIGKSFEIDLFEQVDRQIGRSTARLTFQIR